MTPPHPASSLSLARPRRGGYALLLVLLLLALTSLSLTAAARSSFLRAGAAKEAESALRRRWAVTSTRAALLPKAEKLLATAETRSKKPAPALPLTVRLSDLTLDLLIADEQAKLNVCALADERGPAAAERTVSELVRATGSATAIRLTPHPAWTPARRNSSIYPSARPPARPEPDGDTPPPATPEPPSAEPGPRTPALESWAQLFPQCPPDALMALTTDLTLWGDGALNLKRTTTATSARRFTPALNALDAQKLVALAQSPPDPNDPNSKPLPLPESLLNSMADLITDTSDCHSMWITTRTPTRAWHHLAVFDGAADKGPAVLMFEW